MELKEMKQEWKIVIDIAEKDFCKDDLLEAITDGLENVGNFTLNHLEILGV